MRPASLFAVFVLAKIAMVAGRSLAASAWSPIALFWHDAAVVLVYAAADCALRSRPRIGWALYVALSFYAAINVPVARVLATPLTWPMLRATHGTIADSILYHLTWTNTLLLIALLAAAAIFPELLRRAPIRPVIAALAVCAVLGPVAASRVDTRGYERNAVTALVTTVLPMRSDARGEWRSQGFDRTRHADVSRFHGIARGRNIVVVSLESTAAQYLGVYGASPDPMPNLSALARQALVFEHAYAVYPESIKELYSILCSIYPAFRSRAEDYAAFPCDSVARSLATAGYRTALFHPGRFMYLGMEAVIRNRGFDTLADAGDIGGNRESSFGVDEPAAVTAMLKWIDQSPGRRFFLYYMPIAGHHPYESPVQGPFPAGDEFGRYRNALRYGDESLGRLIRGLQERGLSRETVWVILGDHGEAFGQHEGNFGHTFHLYDENVRVPFLIAAPGVIERQIRSRQVVSLIDTAPTLLDLAGLKSPASYQGRSVLDGEPRMAFFFADYSLGLLGLRDGSRKLIHDLGSGRSRLFDLENDPRENADIAARYPFETRWYAENLRNWIASR